MPGKPPSQMYDTEDTDPIPLEGGEKAEQEEDAKPGSLWLRILGGVLLAVAVGFIIYGLTVSAGNSPVAQKEAGTKPIIAKGLTNIPADESRSFQYYQLPNGLKVVNVQDDRALQMAFAVAVQTGSFNDPTNLPGLAHFCEHMLFAGTKKYPEASDFDNFISAHGGTNNAWTSEEVSVYFASLSQDAAADGLDHFADFFRSPLFQAAQMEKEVNAIEKLHAKNVQNPERQVLEVLYSLANPDSPISRFQTGNIDTLSTKPKQMQPPVDPVAAVVEYWKEHYCPNHMSLVTVGSDTLTAQMDLVKQVFSDLKPQSAECQKPVRKYDVPQAWPEERLMKWINIMADVPKSKLWLMFPLPDVSKDYLSQPLQYLNYMLTYGGENSLSRVLKDNIGLASSFETMYDTTSAGTNVIFVLELTKLGQDNIELLLDVVFAYLTRLHQKGVDDSLYDSLATIARIKWDWGEPDSPAGTADTLAERMTRVDDATKLLSADSLIEQPNPLMVKALMERIKPANMNIAYINPKCDNASGHCSGISESEFFKDQDSTLLPYYKVKYSVVEYMDVLPKALQRWEGWLNGDIRKIEAHIKKKVHHANIKTVSGKHWIATPPRPIKGIPKEIPLEHMHASFGDVAHFQEHGGIDALLFGSWPESVGTSKLPSEGAARLHVDKSEVWYRSGWVTTSPKVHLSLSLRPLLTQDHEENKPISDVLLELYGRLLGEEMAPKLVDLTVTGVSYEIDVGRDGLKLNFVGFEPSMPNLISQVLSEFNRFNEGPDITPDVRFDRTVRSLREDLTTYSDLPMNYAIADRNLLLTKGPHARDELLHELDQINNGGISVQKVAQSVSDLLLNNGLRATALAMGNLDKKKARDTVRHILHTIKVPPPGPSAHLAQDRNSNGELERLTPIADINQPIEVRKLNPKQSDPNDVVAVSFLVGPSTVETRVNLGLISELFKVVAYDELQTNRQLGSVSAGVVLLSNVLVISAVVQGKAKSADEMEAAVQGVLTNLMVKRLNDLSEKEIAQYKASYRQELIQPPTTASEEFQHFAGPVDQGGICFQLQNEMLRYLDGPMATKDTLIAEWKERILPSAGERKQVVVKYFAGDKIPPRPNVSMANAAWTQEQIPANAIALLTREYKNTKLLAKAGSKERAELVKAKGWFPTEQDCTLKDPDKSAAKGAPEVPEQVRNIVQQKTQDVFQGIHRTPYVPEVKGKSAWAASRLAESPQEVSSMELMSYVVPAVRGGRPHRLHRRSALQP